VDAAVDFFEISDDLPGVVDAGRVGAARAERIIEGRVLARATCELL
jgi:hypothetical protein